MRRRDITRMLLPTVAAAVAVPRTANAQSCMEPCYPRTQTEIDALVVPQNNAFPPGDVRRYGATGQEGAADHAAFVDAFKANDHIYVPPGTYLISSEIVVNRSGIRIEGGGMGNTILKLGAGAASGASCLRWSAYAEDVKISDLTIILSAGAANARGLRFAHLRSSRIVDVAIKGRSSANDDTTGIRFDGAGPGTFTGDVTIDRCHIVNHLIGVDVQGVCTTVRIVNSEFYGTGAALGVVNTRGVNIASTCTGALVSGCTFDQWTRGIYAEGSYLRQVGNYFEGSNPQWEWVRGAGNARIWGTSVGDILLGNGTPIFPRNDWDSCRVFGQAGLFAASDYSEASRGYSSTQNSWSLPPLKMGSYSLWVDSAGRLRIKNGVPASDADGAAIGSQS
jgi:hypothetical protein